MFREQYNGNDNDRAVATRKTKLKLWLTLLLCVIANMWDYVSCFDMMLINLDRLLINPYLVRKIISENSIKWSLKLFLCHTTSLPKHKIWAVKYVENTQRFSYLAYTPCFFIFRTYILRITEPKVKYLLTSFKFMECFAKQRFRLIKCIFFDFVLPGQSTKS